jgi:hypothetical protein
MIALNSGVDPDWLSFKILLVLDGNNLTSLEIGEVFTDILEDLPPS